MFDEERQDLMIKRSKRIVQGINKELQKRKKIKIFLYVCMFLWGSVVAQLIAERVFTVQVELTETFSKSNTILNESMIELMGYHGDGYHTEADKINLVRYLAEGIGIEVDETNIVYEKGEDKEVFIFMKEAKQAVTTIKYVTLDGDYSKGGKKEHYIFVRILIIEDNNQDILIYKNQVLDLYDALGIEMINDTTQLTGYFTGRLTLGELDSISKRMLDEMDGKVVFENRDTDLYTVYAYCRGMKDYITVDGIKMNVQIAAVYDESRDLTKIYLAVPIISGSW